MTGLPQYDNPQVQAQAAPPISPHAGRNIEAPDYTGAIGQGLQAGAAGLYRIQEQAATTRAQEAHNALSQWDIDQMNHASTLNGADAIGMTPKLLADRAKYAESLSKGMDPMTLKLFNRAAAQSGLSFQSSVEHTETAKGQEFQRTVISDKKALALSKIASTVHDPVALESNLDELRATVAHENELAGATGDSPEAKAVAQANMLSATTQAHATVISTYLNEHNPKAAKAYFDEHKDEIDGQSAEKIDHVVNGSLDSVKAIDLVDRAMASGEKNPDDFIRNAAHDDPEVLKLAREEYQHRHLMQKEATQANLEDARGKISEMVIPLNGGSSMSWAQVRQTPQWQGLDPDQQHAVFTHVVEMQKQLKEGKDGEGEVEKYAKFFDLTEDPHKLMSMSLDQIKGFRNVLGGKLTIQLMDTQRRYLAKANEVRQVHLDTTMLKDEARNAGLNVDTQLTDTDRARLGQLRAMVEDQIADEQKKVGDFLPEERKREITQDALKTVKTQQPGTLWGTNAVDKKVFEVDDPSTLDTTDPDTARLAPQIRARLNEAGVKRLNGRVLQIMQQQRISNTPENFDAVKRRLLGLDKAQ